MVCVGGYTCHMGSVTKKALEEARAAVLAEYEKEIEARAVVSVVENQREAAARERDEAIAAAHAKFDGKVRDLDLELAVAVAGLRENMAAKVLAGKFGVTVARQKELLDMLDSDTADTSGTPDTETGVVTETDTGDSTSTSTGDRAVAAADTADISHAV